MPKGEANASKTHCPQGHEYTEENTYRHGPEGRYRHCRTCLRDRPQTVQRRRSSCKYGHEYTEDNSYYSKDGTRRSCRECALERAKTNVTRADRKVYKWQYTYRLTLDDVKRMWAENGGVCPVCRVAGPDLDDDIASDERSFWVVDHDHACCPGIRSCGDCVRGLLCSACNKGLGYFRDDLDTMQRAIDYLGR